MQHDEELWCLCDSKQRAGKADLKQTKLTGSESVALWIVCSLSAARHVSYFLSVWVFLRVSKRFMSIYCVRITPKRVWRNKFLPSIKSKASPRIFSHQKRYQTACQARKSITESHEEELKKTDWSANSQRKWFWLLGEPEQPVSFPVHQIPRLCHRPLCLIQTYSMRKPFNAEMRSTEI